MSLFFISYTKYPLFFVDKNKISQYNVYKDLKNKGQGRKYFFAQ